MAIYRFGVTLTYLYEIYLPRRHNLMTITRKCQRDAIAKLLGAIADIDPRVLPGPFTRASPVCVEESSSRKPVAVGALSARELVPFPLGHFFGLAAGRPGGGHVKVDADGEKVADPLLRKRSAQCRAETVGLVGCNPVDRDVDDDSMPDLFQAIAGSVQKV